MRFFTLALVVISLAMLNSCDSKIERTPIDWEAVKIDIEKELHQNILDKWYPVIIDQEFGGYLSNLSFAFEPMEKQNKMIVTQARHLWVTSLVAKRQNDSRYTGYAAHGFSFLQKMWDQAYGGFYQDVDRAGSPLSEIKTAYGNAFAIYGLSAYFDATNDSTALHLAIDTFHWLEEHSYDPEFGGYFQILSREGEPLPKSAGVDSFSPAGYKDQNSSIHLLEAFTSLYHVWPDALLRDRLSGMYHLIKDVMINDRHYLDLFFEPDLTPVSFYGKDSLTILKNYAMDHVSFGHDIETAFLLLEAAEALHLPVDQGLQDELRKVVDHALLGLDPKNGGLYDAGYYFDRSKPISIIKDSKAWWAQAEALNTLLIFHQFYPDAGYDQHFTDMWAYIKKYIIDQQHGGWYINGIDTRPDARQAPKASIWKSTYHNYRALANCMKILTENSH